MLKKFLSKYILEVIPSIMATVIGAYIVTHYINNKPEADKPQAAMATPADPAKAPDTPANNPAKKDDTAQAEKAADKAAKAEAARVKAAEKVAADKAAAEKLASEKAAAAEKAQAERVAAAEKAQAEKVEKEAEARRARERTVAKAAPIAPAVEANAVADDKRDANDLARAAIERLRGSDQPRQAEQPRDTPRVIEASRPQERKVNSVVYTAPSAVQPLPPAVTIAPTPSQNEAMNPAPQGSGSRSAEAQADDSMRLTPPADIPPRQLSAERERPSVAEDVVSAAKSVFQAVVPR